MAPVHESELILGRELAAPCRVFGHRKDVPHFRKGSWPLREAIPEAVVFGNFVFVVDLLRRVGGGERGRTRSPWCFRSAPTFRSAFGAGADEPHPRLFVDAKADNEDVKEIAVISEAPRSPRLSLAF